MYTFRKVSMLSSSGEAFILYTRFEKLPFCHLQVKHLLLQDHRQCPSVFEIAMDVL